VEKPEKNKKGKHDCKTSSKKRKTSDKKIKRQEMKKSKGSKITLPEDILDGDYESESSSGSGSCSETVVVVKKSQRKLTKRERQRERLRRERQKKINSSNERPSLAQGPSEREFRLELEALGLRRDLEDCRKRERARTEDDVVNRYY